VQAPESPRADVDRARALIEESREIVVVLDESRRVVTASRRARESLDGLIEGSVLPDELLHLGGRTPIGSAYLPLVGVRWLWPSWAEAGQGESPYDRDQKIEWAEPTPRPPTIVHLDDLEGDYGGIAKHPGREAGAKITGLNWIALPPREEGAPPHCHSADEELFVILDGEGALELWGKPDPENQLQTEPAETHPVRRGHVISRPAATRIAHSLRAGPNGLTYLAYGTREPNDMCWYPRSNKVFFRGLGVIGRLELLDYSDGEPS